MNVFTGEFIEDLKKRYGSSGITAPPIFRLSTVAKFEPHREAIERWIDRLSAEDRDIVVSKIRNPKSFKHTYNELKIAGVLLARYPIVRYEQEFFGLTPDWTVTTHSGEVLLVVEVLTRDRSTKDKSLSARVDKLWGMITNLEIGVGIHLSFADEFDERDFDSKVIKQIFIAFEKWLAQRPSPGSTKTFGNLEFKITQYSQKWQNVQMLGPARSFWVGGTILKENIEDKVKKYRSVVEKLQVPFAVAIVPDFNTGVTKSTLEDILFGQEAYIFFENRAGYYGRKPDGIFAKRHHLSAVIGYFDGEVEILHNPDARKSLQDFVIAAKC